jgi:hypothetical protein
VTNGRGITQDRRLAADMATAGTGSRRPATRLTERTWMNDRPATTPRPSRHRRVVASLVLAALVAGLGALGPGSSPVVAAPTVTPASLTYGELLVDEVGGHVFATAADSVAVFDLDGRRTGTIPDQFGARDLILRGRTLYVLASNAARVNVVDADTLTMTGGWSIETAPYAATMAWGAGRIWFTYGDQWSGGLASLDPTTGTVRTSLAPLLYADGHVEATDTRVYVLDRGLSPSKIHAYDITTDPPTGLGATPHSNACGNGREVAVHPDGIRAWTACGAPYRFNQWNLTTLAEPAISYPATNYPNAIVLNDAGTLLLGALDAHYDRDIYLYDVGRPTILKSYETTSDVMAGMIGLTSSGSRLYAATEDGALRTIDQRPTITGPAGPVRVDGSTSLRLTGSGFTDVTSVTVDGEPVPFVIASDGVLTATVEDLSPGSHPVLLTSRWGTSAHTPLHVYAEYPGPSAPGAPVVTATPPQAVDLSWSAPTEDHGSPVTGYRVRAFLPGSQVPVQEVTTGAAATTGRISGLESERPYEVSVTAVNALGAGEPSARTTVTAGLPPIAPFTTVTAYVNRQHRDLLGRLPTVSERDLWATALRRGTAAPAAVATTLRRSKEHADAVDGVTRLYLAYFTRLPDTAGLDHWAGRRRAGTSLQAISQSFAGSAEFRRQYAALGNADFVRLVYRNVLHRAPDAAGLSFWTAELDSGRRTRGSVMTGFSESSEFRGNQASTVHSGVLHALLLRRPPTSGEHATFVDALDSGTPLEVLVAGLLSSPAYVARGVG